MNSKDKTAIKRFRLEKMERIEFRITFRTQHLNTDVGSGHPTVRIHVAII
jgi:hypothetical protein